MVTNQSNVSTDVYTSVFSVILHIVGNLTQLNLTMTDQKYAFFKNDSHLDTVDCKAYLMTYYLKGNFSQHHRCVLHHTLLIFTSFLGIMSTNILRDGVTHIKVEIWWNHL